jgi:transcriptional regulator with XRE-family HTH domain
LIDTKTTEMEKRVMAMVGKRPMYVTIGEAIRHHRLEKGLSQSKLANQIGVTNQTVSNWETGQVHQIEQKNLEKLAEVLGVDIRELLAAPRPSGLSAQAIQIAMIYDGLPKDMKNWLLYNARKMQAEHEKKGNGHGEQRRKLGDGNGEFANKSNTRQRYVMLNRECLEWPEFKAGDDITTEIELQHYAHLS